MSHKDAQDKDDWRLGIKEATHKHRFIGKMALKIANLDFHPSRVVLTSG